MQTPKEKLLGLLRPIETTVLTGIDIDLWRDACTSVRELRAAIESGVEDHGKTIIIIDTSKIGGGE